MVTPETSERISPDADRLAWLSEQIALLEATQALDPQFWPGDVPS